MAERHQVPHATQPHVDRSKTIILVTSNAQPAFLPFLKDLHHNLLYALVAQGARLGRPGSLVQRGAVVAHASVQRVAVQESRHRVRVLADDALVAVVVIVSLAAYALGTQNASRWRRVVAADASVRSQGNSYPNVVLYKFCAMDITA